MYLFHIFRAEYTTSGMNHIEGGWPKDINMNDPEATLRYRRKIEKDDAYIHAVMHLGHVRNNRFRKAFSILNKTVAKVQI